MSPTPLIRRDPDRAHGFTFDTDNDGSIFVWVGHRTHLTDDLLHAINDAYQHHINNLTPDHATAPTIASHTPWGDRIADQWADQPVAPRTPSDEPRTTSDGQLPQ